MDNALDKAFEPTAVYEIKGYCPYLKREHAVLAQYRIEYLLSCCLPPDCKLLNITCDKAAECSLGKCPLEDEAQKFPWLSDPQLRR